MNKIEIQDVSFVYSKGTPFERCALDHVSCSFEEGKITGLIGHTGSGKSSLVNLLNGLYRPTEGRVLLDGKDIWEHPRDIGKIRFRVGLVMQYPEYQLFEETVWRDIAFAPKNLGLNDEEIAERVKEAAQFVGIPEDWMEKSPFELSGGQKRRVAIAGVLAMSPEVLILDEPAAGLDPRGRRDILSGLCSYAKQKGITVILVSHSMEDMASYCDNVIVMEKSRVFRAGRVEDIFGRANDLVEVGLNVPEVSLIAERLRAAGLALEGNLYTVEGVYQALLSRKEGRA